MLEVADLDLQKCVEQYVIQVLQVHYKVLLKPKYLHKQVELVWTYEDYIGNAYRGSICLHGL